MWYILDAHFCWLGETVKTDLKKKIYNFWSLVCLATVNEK